MVHIERTPIVHFISKARFHLHRQLTEGNSDRRQKETGPQGELNETGLPQRQKSNAAIRRKIKKVTRRRKENE
jgi:hypothetical protein